MDVRAANGRLAGCRTRGWLAGEYLARRRSLGVRLWLPDVAPRFRLRRKRARLGSWLSPLPLHLFSRPSRHARASGPRSRPGPGRLLPGHGLSGRGAGPGTDDPLSARARAGHRRLSGKNRWRPVCGRRLRQRARLCRRPQPPPICRPLADRRNDSPRRRRNRDQWRQSRLCAQHLRASAPARHPRRRALGDRAAARPVILPDRSRPRVGAVTGRRRGDSERKKAGASLGL